MNPVTELYNPLLCSICNPNCYKNHRKMDKVGFCGDEKCPMNPKRLFGAGLVEKKET